MMSWVRSLKLMVAGALSLAVIAPAVMPAVAFAAVDTTSVCQGVSVSGGGCSSDATPFTNVIKFVIQLISIIAGVAAVIMIVVAGLRFVTSNGDSNKVAGARSAIIYAIIGLIVVALSQVVVQFVLSHSTNGAKV
jgi:hypothetical protein